MPAFPTDEPLHIDRPLLAFDTGSPTVSVAVVAPGGDLRTPRILAQRSLEQRASSKELIPAARSLLAEVGLGVGELGGLVALRGPGSFTGLRVGLATVMGLEQATTLPVAAVSTLHAVAAAGAAQLGEELFMAEDGAVPGMLHAVVDALRGEWSLQRFAIGRREPASPAGPIALHPVAPPELVSAEALPTLSGPVIGFGVDAIELPSVGAPRATFLSPPVLAPWAGQIALAQGSVWDKALLMRPLYARAPAVTMPTKRPPVGGS